MDLHLIDEALSLFTYLYIFVGRDKYMTGVVIKTTALTLRSFWFESKSNEMDRVPFTDELSYLILYDRVRLISLTLTPLYPATFLFFIIVFRRYQIERIMNKFAL